MTETSIIVVSLGGNAIIRRGEKGTIEEQFDHTVACVAGISRLIADDGKVVITHGNGPIVGNIVIRNECAKNTIPPMPLYICDADSEGGIGFMIQQALYNGLREIKKVRDVVTVITQVVVDRGDPAFKNPTKPIGPYYAKDEADELKRTRGWSFTYISGNIGADGRRDASYRRVVPSPKPVRIVEKDIIRRLALEGVVVIAAGGGGVPVAESGDGRLGGVEAVVDKDFSTGLLAGEIGAHRIFNLTEVDMVYLNFGTPEQKGLSEASLEEMERYLKEGHFPPGNMGPKIESSIEFLRAGGAEVIITRPELMGEAMAGRAGTRIRR